MKKLAAFIFFLAAVFSYFPSKAVIFTDKDTLFLINGDTLYGEVLKVSDKVIVYKSAKNEKIKKVRQKKVNKISYSDGKQDILHNYKPLPKKLYIITILSMFILLPITFFSSALGAVYSSIILYYIFSGSFSLLTLAFNFYGAISLKTFLDFKKNHDPKLKFPLVNFLIFSSIYILIGLFFINILWLIIFCC